MQKINKKSITPGKFVAVHTGMNEFEIGIVRGGIHNEDLNIFLLTDEKFTKVPPSFDEKNPPFLVNGHKDVAIDAHPVFYIQTRAVKSLISKQTVLFKKNYKDAERAYQQYPNKKGKRVLKAKEKKMYAQLMVDAFGRITSYITNLRNKN